MKKSLILFATGLLATAGVINAETINGTSGAKLIGIALSITEDTELNFGNIILVSEESVVTLTSSGASVTTGDAIFNGGHSMGTFTLTGEPNTTLGYIAAGGTPDLTTSGSAVRIVSSIGIDGAAPTVLDNTGKATFNVVGFIVIRYNSVAGVYTGTYPVTYSY